MILVRSLFLFCFLMTMALLEAKQGKIVYLTHPSLPVTPWFTGPLLTPSGHVVAHGHQNWDFYVFYNSPHFFYDNQWKKHKKETTKVRMGQLNIQVGLLEGLDLGISPSFSYNSLQNVHSKGWRDLPLAFGIRLSEGLDTDFFPATKLHLGLNIPCGKYDRGKESKLGTDLMGSGSWSPSIGICFSKLFLSDHILSLSSRTAISYLFSTKVTVVGNNSYFQPPNNHKFKVYPGQLLSIQQGLELSLTQNIVVALDILYEYHTKIRFSGPFKNSLPNSQPSIGLSVAPAVEYNFSENIGLIVGGWFALLGKNYAKISTYVFSLNIYH